MRDLVFLTLTRICAAARSDASVMPRASASNSRSMPSRNPRSATRSCAQGHSSQIGGEDRAARQHQIGAIRPDAAHGGAAGQIQLPQGGRQRPAMSAQSMPARIDPGAVVARKPKRDAGQRRDRAGGAQQMMRDGIERGDRDPSRPAADESARSSGARMRLIAGAVGRGGRPTLRPASPRRPARNAMRRPVGAPSCVAAHPDDFGRAAADVEDQSRLAASGSISGAQPSAASRASSSGVMIVQLDAGFGARAFEQAHRIARRAGRPRSRWRARVRRPWRGCARRRS